jgi:hypothetical protein
MGWSICRRFHCPPERWGCPNLRSLDCPDSDRCGYRAHQAGDFSDTALQTKVAREAVALDQLSGGRFLLGVGSGDAGEAGFSRVNEARGQRAGPDSRRGAGYHCRALEREALQLSGTPLKPSSRLRCNSHASLSWSAVADPCMGRPGEQPAMIGAACII